MASDTATRSDPDVGKALEAAVGSPVVIVTKGDRVIGAAGTLTVGAVRNGVVVLERRGLPAYDVPVRSINAVTVFLVPEESGR